MSMPHLKLKGMSFAELFAPAGLARLDQQFLAFLHEKNAELHVQLLRYRETMQDFSTLQVSELLLHIAPIVEDFLIELFSIENAAAALRAQTLAHNPVAAFKKNFILRRVKKQLTHADNHGDFTA